MLGRKDTQQILWEEEKGNSNQAYNKSQHVARIAKLFKENPKRSQELVKV